MIMGNHVKRCYFQVLGSTLILTWIPNTALKKNPRSIENSPMHARPSPRRSPRQEYAGRSTPTSCSTDDGGGDSDRYGTNSARQLEVATL